MRDYYTPRIFKSTTNARTDDADEEGDPLLLYFPSFFLPLSPFGISRTIPIKSLMSFIAPHHLFFIYCHANYLLVNFVYLTYELLREFRDPILNSMCTSVLEIFLRQVVVNVYYDTYDLYSLVFYKMYYNSCITCLF